MAQQTAMQQALARIELIKDINPNSVHWEMFKNDCMEEEKEQIKFAYNDGADAIVAGTYKSMEDYYNELYQSRQDKTDK